MSGRATLCWQTGRWNFMALCLCLFLSRVRLARATGDFNEATIAPPPTFPHHHHHQTAHLLSSHSTAALCTAPPACERADRVSSEFACLCDTDVIAAWEWRWHPLNEGSRPTRFVVTLRARALGWSFFLPTVGGRKKKPVTQSHTLTQTYTQSHTTMCAHQTVTFTVQHASHVPYLNVLVHSAVERASSEEYFI